ncbi:MAG: 3-oxoacyl-ACP synthase III family protein, partial [Candidatus Paceibacteria bacterium]
LFTNFGIKREEIDLLIFASAGQDLIEPATSHIIQNLLQTNARVFDIKNACNAFIDALSIGHNFIQNNEHQRILIVSGEASSKAIKWRLTDKQDFKNSFAGYTFGDLGTAILLEKDPYPNHSMTFTYFSDSSVWSSGTLPGGGSRHPHDEAYTYFQGNAAGLDTVFRNSFPSFYTSFLKKNNLNVEDIKHVCMHQVTRSYTEEMVKYLNINPNNLQTTISTYGNVAACTLPLQLNLFRQEHTFNHGDITLLIGLAGGMSITLGLLRW